MLWPASWRNDSLACMKSFPEEKLSSLLQDLTRLAEQSTTPRIAAFDADGTLWRNDLGELFFQYQIDLKKLEPLTKDPWGYYEEVKNHDDPEKAYLWLA